VFDVACALVDVLSFVTPPEPENDISPTTYLFQIATLLAQLPGGMSKFVPLLLTKVKELLPESSKSLCETLMIPSTPFNDPMSPNTRSTYDEEVGRGLYTDLKRMR
jgi:hypothetical protein